jgi:ankyrin repeat protein
MNQTPLMVASSRNLLSITKLLIMHGSDLNHKDLAGRSALFFAVKYSYFEMAILLVANFGGCFVTDKYGKCLLDINSDPLMQLIIEKGKLY